MFISRGLRNRRTTMIATLNPEPEHTDESISTCRFAQRVARVKNSATVNESLDPTILAAQLKVRVSALEAELALSRGLGEGGGGGGGAGQWCSRVGATFTGVKGGCETGYSTLDAPTHGLPSLGVWKTYHHGKNKARPGHFENGCCARVKQPRLRDCC